MKDTESTKEIEGENEIGIERKAGRAGRETEEREEKRRRERYVKKEKS